MRNTCELQAGSRVEVVDLQSAKHNGSQGIVLSAAESDNAENAYEKGRRPVRLDGGELLSLKPANLRTAAYTICSVAGKGMGVVAARDIKRGERLIAEPPLLTFDPNSEPSGVVAAVNNLPPTRRASFDSLHNAHPGMGVLGTLSTNCIEVGSRTGIFGIISRFNHSCVPNVEWNWNDNLNAETIHATRDISYGEELCASYLGMEARPGLCSSRDERSERLQASYGFVCSCPVCTLTGEELSKSDRRRRAIFDLDQEIWDAVMKANVQKRDAGGEELVQRRLQLLEEEGLDENSVRNRCMYDAYQACKYLGLHRRARTWLEDAAQHAKLFAGADSPEYERYVRMLKRPLNDPHDPCYD